MRNLNKTGKKINSLIGKAISAYNLIGEGDKILVAVSGGKDSLTLLSLLKAIQGWAPVKFELMAAHISTDFHCGSYLHNNVLTDFFEDLGVKYFFGEAEVLDENSKTNCFWCSWNKRKALFEIAEANGCGKVAFGHHKDDIAENILMNMLYKGEISGMNPKQEMFDGKITIIRPLCFVEERFISEYAKEAGFSQQMSQCPYGENSKRKYVKNLIRDAEIDAPKANIKTNIMKSLSRIKKDYIDIREPGGVDEKDN